MVIFKTTFVLLNALLFCTSIHLIQTKSLPEIDSKDDDNEQEIVDEQLFIDNDAEGSGELDNTNNANGFDEGQIYDKPDIDEDQNEPEEEEIAVQEDEVNAVDEEKKDAEEDREIENEEIGKDEEQTSSNSDADKDEAGEENVEESFVKDDEDKNGEQQDVEDGDKKKPDEDEEIKSSKERMQELLDLLDDIQKSLSEMISANTDSSRYTTTGGSMLT